MDKPSQITDISSLTVPHHLSVIQQLEKSGLNLFGSASFNALILRFINVLRSDFSLKNYGILYEVCSPDSDHSWRPTKVESSNGGLEKNLCEKIIAQFSNLRSSGHPCGFLVTTLIKDDQEYQVSLIDGNSGEDYLLIWNYLDAQSASEKRIREAKVNFLLTQLQNELCWLRKLDETQAMLYRDDLTGLYNHRFLDVCVEAELKRATRFNSQFCILFMDLDGFKSVNDNHGHLSGSGVLKQVASVLRHTLREVDTIIRYGGDEFVVLLLGVNSATGLLAGERIRKAIEKNQFTVEDRGHVHLTVSIGIAAFPEHAKTKKGLISLADKLMYVSKKNGKNRVNLFESPKKSPKRDHLKSTL